MLKLNCLVTLSAAVILFFSQSVIADEALAKSKNCLACHSVDNKIIGPAFKDVAAKYKGDEGAVATLSAKVKMVVVVLGVKCQCRLIQLPMMKRLIP